MRVPWTTRRLNQSILKEINTEYSLEGLMLKLKLQYFGHLMRRTNSLERTLMNLLQHHTSKVTILWHSALFMVQVSYPYMTTGKTIALTIWTFVSKVMSAKLLDVLSRLVIAFLPRSKCLLILWLQSPSVVILEPKKIKSATVSTKII